MYSIKVTSTFTSMNLKKKLKLKIFYAYQFHEFDFYNTNLDGWRELLAETNSFSETKIHRGNVKGQHPNPNTYIKHTPPGSFGEYLYDHDKKKNESSVLKSLNQQKG